MQHCRHTGLAPAAVSERRCAVKCIHADDGAIEDQLFNMWEHKTPYQAREILSRTDVVVTNQSDKIVVLPKLSALDEQVRRQRDAPFY